MRNELNLWVAGGDMRQAKLAELLAADGHTVHAYALERCVDEHVRDWNSVKTRVREALSSYIYRRTKRSPMILPILMEV